MAELLLMLRAMVPMLGAAAGQLHLWACTVPASCICQLTRGSQAALPARLR